MASGSILSEPGRVDEPRGAREYSDVLTQVASERRAVIVRRDGADLAAVVPIEHLELLRELVARAEAEKLAAQIAWDRVIPGHAPPPVWFDADDNPFQPQEEEAP